MAKQMPRGRPFKKGQSGNPGGMRKIPADIRRASHLTAIEFIALCNKFFSMTKLELTEVVNSNKSTTLQLLVASLIHKGVIEGDPKRFTFLLDRMIGSVPKNMELDVTKRLEDIIAGSWKE